MRTIVLLLIAALVMTPALVHAGGFGSNTGGTGAAGLLLLAIPVVGFALLVVGLVEIAKKVGDKQYIESQHSTTGPAPAVGSDR
jgi:hypothetical protein